MSRSTERTAGMNLFGGAPSGDAESSASECGGIRSSCFHLAEVDGDAAGSQVENADIVHLICLSNFSTCQRHGSGGSLRHLATARPTRCRVQRQAGGRWIYFVTRGSFAGRQIYIQLALFGYFYEAEGGRERGRRKARRWRCGRAAASSYSAVIGRQFFSEQQISAARPPGRPWSMELLFCLRPSKRLLAAAGRRRLRRRPLRAAVATAKVGARRPVARTVGRPRSCRWNKFWNSRPEMVT